MPILHREPRALLAVALSFSLITTMPLPANALVGVERGRDGPHLLLHGEIKGMEHCQVATLLAANPEIRRVVVRSSGGDAWAGAQIARLFGWAGLEAIVPPDGYAYSSAGIAVLGAPTRRIAGYLGLHRPYAGEPRTAFGVALATEVSEETESVLREAGLDEQTIRLAMTTRASGMFLTITPAAVNGFHHRGVRDRDRVEKIAANCQSLG